MRLHTLAHRQIVWMMLMVSLFSVLRVRLDDINTICGLQISYLWKPHTHKHQPNSPWTTFYSDRKTRRCNQHTNTQHNTCRRFVFYGFQVQMPSNIFIIINDTTYRVEFTTEIVTIRYQNRSLKAFLNRNCQYQLRLAMATSAHCLLCLSQIATQKISMNR